MGENFMAGKFQWKRFVDVNVNDVFFDSLKADYPGFGEWFKKKGLENEEALVFNDDEGIGAFLYLKDENEPLILTDRTVPASPRIKIGTLRLAERFRGLRLGEGALGISLWRWQKSDVREIYVTIFNKHELLIKLFEKFGFSCVGQNSKGEYVYLKSKDDLDYADPYKSFPFINPDFKKAGMIPVQELYHDKLFIHSKLMRSNKQNEEFTAGNGVTKVFIATPYATTSYSQGEPIVIYRIFDGDGKIYKSVVTSFCTITDIEVIKNKYISNVSLSQFVQKAGNKTVYSEDELKKIYNNNKNVLMIEMLYNGFFGEGNNVNCKSLKDNRLFETHPYQIEYNKEEFIKILEMGDKNARNVIID